MNGAELAASITGALLTAFALGWLAHWLWARMARAASPLQDRVDELAHELITIEADREQFAINAAEREAAIQAAADAAVAKAAAALREREAELRALDDGLRNAREEMETLRRGG
ncbi:MAG: hypothetical protein WD969_11515 [Paracoccaceae bacterium]